ncbi:zf-HC2 domain-containing protein [Microbacterium deminutum]|uniref:Zf-HC2 domain-containing protein n=1 Tax=Microbacterium deminutum TaxID=344164 RepID=A0ABP5CBJ4_9MICO
MTHPDHAQFAEWDAAYVLGALSPTDRRRFEAHLADCDACRGSIIEMAPTIGLLSRVSPERAESLLDPPADEGPDESRRRDVIALGTRQSRRRRTAWWAGGIAAAAAILVAVVLAATLAIAPAMRNVQVVALDRVVDLPLTATVELTDVAWGTRIEMICRYTDNPHPDEPAAGHPYSLVIEAKDGTTSEVSSWLAFPGATARLGAGTALDPDQIKAIEIRSVTTGRILMRSELGG